MTKLYRLTDTDAAQVKAILLTHAEMQDHRTLESMSVLGRLKRDEPDDEDAQETMIDLQGSILDLEVDCDNLKRIADIFN